MAPGEGATEPAILPSRRPGLLWRCLGMAEVARG